MGSTLDSINEGRRRYNEILANGVFDKWLKDHNAHFDPTYGLFIPDPFSVHVWNENIEVYYHVAPEYYAKMKQSLETSLADDPCHDDWEALMNKVTRGVHKPAHFNAINYGVLRLNLSAYMFMTDGYDSEAIQKMSCADMATELLSDPVDFLSLTVRYGSIYTSISPFISNPGARLKRMRKKKVDEKQCALSAKMWLVTPICGATHKQILLNKGLITSSNADQMLIAASSNNKMRQHLMKGTACGILDTCGDNLRYEVREAILAYKALPRRKRTPLSHKHDQLQP